MAEGGTVKTSMVSVVEDVIQQHGKFNLIDVASRRAQEAALRRNEAAEWMRKILGVAGRRDLPDSPSEEEFRLALRSGIVLCNLLNKVQPGTVPKVVEAPAASMNVPDGAALSVFQYFENVRNFRVSVEEMGISSFEASDLEEGGNLSRIVHCILALKSYYEWKEAGSNGLWKGGGNQKPATTAVKQFIRRNAGLFTKSLARTTSAEEKSGESPQSAQSAPSGEKSTPGDAEMGSLASLIQELLQDKKQEDIPAIIESMLSKLMEEFEQKITLQTEQSKTVSDSTAISDSVKAPVEIVPQLSVSNSNNNLAEIAVHNENEVAASKEEAAETSKEVAASEEEAAEIEEVAASEEEAAETSKGVEASEEEAAETSKGVEASEDEAEETSKGVEASEDEAEETSKGVEASKEEAAETSKGVAASKEEAAERSKRVAASKERVVRTSKGVAASKEGAVRTSKGVAPSKVETSKRVAASKKEAVETSKGVATSKVEAVKTSERVAASKEVASKEVASKEVAVQPPPPTVVVVCNCKKPDPVKLKIQFERRQMMTEKHLRDIQELRNVLAAVKGDVGVIKTKYKEEVSNLGNHLQTVTHAAKQYKKVLEENRKLYNVIQDLKGNIRVYCRVRPFLPGQENSVTVVGGLDDGSITITSNSKGGKDSRKTFTFNKVYGPNATQVEIFSDTQPLIRSVLDGYNVCIFAYGQTGAGKTHTMSGPKHITEETAGVNYRALGDLFLISDERKDMIAYDINVQMIEIYNEQVRDLLATDGVVRRLEIRNNSQTGINVPDANLVPVKTTSDVITLMDLGHKNRAVSSTSMNDRSSRSHSCLTVHVQGKDLSSGQRVRGCMHLVDLAGSERIEKSEVVGDALKEAQHINKSLAALGDVIASLSHKSGHVPYRNSKLTQLLQDSLGGQAKTLMFVCMSPEPHALMETLSTLKFAERVSSVELGAAKSNKDSSETKELKQQISSLKAALARQDGDAFGEDDAWDEDNDDNDAATSDSDADHLNQSISRPSSLPNLGAAGQKAKKPPSKLSTAPDKRSAVPAPAKKKVPTGATPVSKTTKSPAPARKPINAK